MLRSGNISSLFFSKHHLGGVSAARKYDLLDETFLSNHLLIQKIFFSCSPWDGIGPQRGLHEGMGSKRKERKGTLEPALVRPFHVLAGLHPTPPYLARPGVLFCLCCWGSSQNHDHVHGPISVLMYSVPISTNVPLGICNRGTVCGVHGLVLQSPSQNGQKKSDDQAV